MSTAYSQSTCYTTEVDELAKFPWGTDSLKSFLDRNMQWVDGRASGKGIIVVIFKVKEDGEIDDVKIKKNLFFNSFEKEAIRLVEIMPKWIPAMKGNRNVCSIMELPIVFELE